MPVKLSKTTGLETNKRGSECLGDGEVGRVNLVKLAASSANLFRLMLKGTIYKRTISAEDTSRSIRYVLLARITREDVGIRCGNIIKYGGIDSKVLGENILWCVTDPVIYHKGRSGLVEICLVKDKKILVLLFETLDGVSGTLGEVPDITIVELLNLVLAIFVDGRDQNRSVIYDTPLGLENT